MPTTRRMDSQLSFRLSRGERRKLEQLAQQAGRSPGNYLRWLLSLRKGPEEGAQAAA